MGIPQVIYGEASLCTCPLKVRLICIALYYELLICKALGMASVIEGSHSFTGHRRIHTFIHKWNKRTLKPPTRSNCSCLREKKLHLRRASSF